MVDDSSLRGREVWRSASFDNHADNRTQNLSNFVLDEFAFTRNTQVMTIENTTSVDDTDARTTVASVGLASDMAEGSMKMARVGDRRVVVVRTAKGFHAIDNACPHQGYGLATGGLSGDLLTCQWHNWKFCVTDGTCVVGEEDVASHPVEIVDGEIMVAVTDPTDEEKLAALWPSLRSGIAKDYRGQIARDTVRLLEAGADPVDIVWEGIRVGAPRADYGVGHEMAAAADCLAMVSDYEGLQRALPIAQALAGISEETRDRPSRSVVVGREGIDFAAAVEAEDLDAATAALMHALESGSTVDAVRSLFIEAVGQHHLSFGHGAIYTQKAFELLDRAGWDRAGELLSHLLTAVVYGTREDTLPYMRAAIRAIDSVDLQALARAGQVRDPQWNGAEDLRRVLLDAKQAPIAEDVAAVCSGAGIEGLLDGVSLAVSERLLRYDTGNEDDLSYDFGWLDITHGLTYSRATRWAWQNHPGEAAARLALFTVFMCFDTSRAERKFGVAAFAPSVADPSGDIEDAISARRPADAVAIALGGDVKDIGAALARTSLADGAGSFIVVAHLVKMARAAQEEAVATGSTLPLAAAARFAAAPRRERFVSSSVTEAIEFVGTGQPPKR